MIINTANLKTLFIGFSTKFNEGLEGAKPTYKTITMMAPSGTAEEEYAWLGAFSKMREWVGDRHINNLALHNFTIKNLKFEDTISIPREKIEDDRFGVFAPVAAEMGRAAALHPDEMVYSLLARGFTEKCYDGQNFFDTDHPSSLNEGNGPIVSCSNYQEGAGAPWFLIDASRAIKPMIWQERIPYKFTSLTDDNDQNVFLKDVYLYGIRARGNAGYGLWQLAYASKADLTVENYEAARAAMRGLKGENGKPLGIVPTHLIVPTALEGKGRRVVSSGLRTVGEETPVAVTNEWAGSAELIVSEHLANS